MSDLTRKPHTTIEKLQKIMALPGQIDIHVHHVNGHYIPFVFHTAPHEEKLGFGPIVTHGLIVAVEDCNELVKALRESLGDKINIYGAGIAPAPGATPVLH